MKFKHIVCGGTFDHLHEGHKKLLAACIKRGERVTIGITDKAMVKHKQYASAIQPYSVRSNYVKRFILKYKASVSIQKISNIYGSTLKDQSIDAIFVTRDTLHGAKIINEKRIQMGMKPLSIITIPFVYDNTNTKISSERIRGGHISREGKSYYKYLISREAHILPESLREELRSPLGRVISSFNSNNSADEAQMEAYAKNQGSTHTIAVGDAITYNLKKYGITPTISVIDGKTRRKALNNKYLAYILEASRSNALNKKGTIQREAIKALYSLFSSGHIGATKQLFIQGEEDLLTLVAVLLAPLNSHVWYGQQGVGAVDIRVTEKKKEIVYNLIQQFM